MADRSNLVSGLYHAALELPPDQRAAFLQDACNGNQSLRLEVESLLQHDADSARFLERPAAVMAADAIAAAGPSMTNRQVGPYRIVRPLGVGGMGEVYRATDTKLGRDVAIKILPAHFTEDPERRARFAREARLLATLNHPHIGAIYGLEEADGLTALVLELVEGPTLADRLERGPMKMRESLTIARQIGEALEAAHAKGIVHRDLKPSNIVLQTSPGSAGEPRAKVLDFGLA
jgi:serine/threonine protein kinase